MTRIFTSEVILAMAVIMVALIPIVAFVSIRSTRRRKDIGKRGVVRLGGKCPLCSGKLLVFDLFRGYNVPYKISAARCQKCKHIEVFSEEK